MPLGAIDAGERRGGYSYPYVCTPLTVLIVDVGTCSSEFEGVVGLLAIGPLPVVCGHGPESGRLIEWLTQTSHPPSYTMHPHLPEKGRSLR